MLQVFKVLPTRVHSETEHSIVNVFLPNSGIYDHFDPNVVSTALMYVVSLTIVVRYVNIG